MLLSTGFVWSNTKTISLVISYKGEIVEKRRMTSKNDSDYINQIKTEYFFDKKKRESFQGDIVIKNDEPVQPKDKHFKVEKLKTIENTPSNMKGISTFESDELSEKIQSLKPMQSITYFWKKTDNQWRPTAKYEYQYPAENQKIQLLYLWNREKNEWKNPKKREKTYNENKEAVFETFWNYDQDSVKFIKETELKSSYLNGKKSEVINTSFHKDGTQSTYKRNIEYTDNEKNQKIYTS